jgi:nitrogen regulatory protein P-II 1
MKKVEAIIRQERLPVVRAALEAIGVRAMTISQVVGHGDQLGVEHQWKGRTYRVDLLPRIKLETVIASTPVDLVVTTIMDAARTGEVGDGKIFISDIEEAIRIRSGERGPVALANASVYDAV